MCQTRTNPTADSVALLESIAFVGVEHEAVLDLSRLVNLIDLYAHHLKGDTGNTGVSFGDFVRDASLLAAAAACAAAESGIDTAVPAPLGSAAGMPACRVRDCRSSVCAAPTFRRDVSAANDDVVRVA